MSVHAHSAAKPGTLKQAQALADAGALLEAADIARSYLKAHPASADAYYLLGVIADAQGEQSEARGFYKRALYLDPGHGEALTHLAAVLGLEGDRAGSQLLLARAERASHQEAALSDPRDLSSPQIGCSDRRLLEPHRRSRRRFVSAPGRVHPLPQLSCARCRRGARAGP